LSEAEVVLVPPGPVTVIWTVLAATAGDVAVIEASEFTVNDVAAVVPNVTAVAPVKPLPEIVTLAPPALGPAVGLTELTAGAAV
jgi:hypothetical protein